MSDTRNDLAQERYQDLIEYFGDEKVAKAILEDREAFKAWFERIRWNVERADELARKLERIKGTTKNDSSELDKNSKKLEKNFGESDCISRADVLQILMDYDYANENALVLKDIKALPSVTPQPCEDAISRQALLNATVNKNSIWNKTTDSKGENLETIISKLPPVTPQPRWIPVSERLPKELEPVNITWINHNPESYYADIKDKPFTATGVYFNGQWYWWSTLCTDILAEYSHNYDDIIDDDIEITAWMPLPEPYNADMRGTENEAN